jgi:hypothetical protein
LPDPRSGPVWRIGGRTSQARGDGEHEKDGVATAGCGNLGTVRERADRLSDLVRGHDLAFGPLSRTPAAIFSAVAVFPSLSRTGEPGSGRRGGGAGRGRLACSSARGTISGPRGARAGPGCSGPGSCCSGPGRSSARPGTRRTASGYGKATGGRLMLFEMAETIIT